MTYCSEAESAKRSSEYKVKIFDLLKRNGKQICVPKYYPTGKMVFVKLQTALDDLPTDRYGIRTEKSNDQVDQFELMIVPGRAFTTCGKRLGRGGGL